MCVWWDWAGLFHCSMPICQRISKVIALTSVSRGIWTWCRVERNFACAHTRSARTHTQAGLSGWFVLPWTTLKLHLHSRLSLSPISLLYGCMITKKGPRLLGLFHYGNNHDHVGWYWHDDYLTQFLTDSWNHNVFIELFLINLPSANCVHFKSSLTEIPIKNITKINDIKPITY